MLCLYFVPKIQECIFICQIGKNVPLVSSASFQPVNKDKEEDKYVWIFQNFIRNEKTSYFT